MSSKLHTPLMLLPTLIVLCFGAGLACAADDAELEQVRSRVADMFAEIDPQDIHASPVDGWYVVQKGSIVAYISEDGRYLLQGDLIDLDNQVNLSEQSRTTARRKLISSVDDDQFIAFTPSEVKFTVTVFTDVDCTYCRKLHSQIDDYLAQGIEVRYILYPRNGPASRSWSTSEKVWCARDRNQALTDAKLDRSFETQKCDSSAITKHYMLGQDVGLTGTPAIIFEDGTLVSGYIPPATLGARLQQIAAD
jgi:thiol:disulfide interchange protein DsbC